MFSYTLLAIALVLGCVSQVSAKVYFKVSLISCLFYRYPEASETVS